MIQLSKDLAQFNKKNQKLRVAIVKSLYHDDLTQSMERSCREQLISNGVNENNITTFEIPGSWEIPLVVKKIADTKKFDGIITFGIIIKGETYHFEIIANECARALMDMALKFNIPIIFEVLATYTLKQAQKRSTGKYNKGIEAAETLLKTIKTLSKI